MYEILGVVKQKSASKILTDTSRMNSSLKFPYLTEAKDLDTLEYSINKEDLIMAKLDYDGKIDIEENQLVRERTLDKYLIKTDNDNNRPSDIALKNNISLFTLSNNVQNNINANKSLQGEFIFDQSKKTPKRTGSADERQTIRKASQQNITTQNPNMSVKSTNRPNNPENYKFEEDKLYLAQVGKCLQESNGSFISCDQNQMMSARSRDGKDIETLSLAEQYYSKSEEKTQNLEGKLREENITERNMLGWNPAEQKPSGRVFNLHISEITSKFNDEHLVNQKDSFCHNSDTEKPEYYEDEESFEICEASQDSSRSKNRMQNFDRINKLGEKRRSKSIISKNNPKDKSYISEDYNVENSQRKCSIGVMPEGFSLNKSVMPKLQECTNIISKISQKSFQEKQQNFNDPRQESETEDVYLYESNINNRSVHGENLMTYEGEEDVDFEWADNDENINVIDESDMKSIPKGIVKVSLTKYSGSTL